MEDDLNFFPKEVNLNFFPKEDYLIFFPNEDNLNFFPKEDALIFISLNGRRPHFFQMEDELHFSNGRITFFL